MEGVDPFGLINISHYSSMKKTITVPWLMTGTDKDPKIGDKLYWVLRRRDGTMFVPGVEERNGVHLGCPDPTCKCPKKF